MRLSSDACPYAVVSLCEHTPENSWKGRLRRDTDQHTRKPVILAHLAGETGGPTGLFEGGQESLGNVGDLAVVYHHFLVQFAYLFQWEFSGESRQYALEHRFGI